MKLVFKNDAKTIAAMQKAYEKLRLLHEQKEAAQRQARDRYWNNR